MPLLDGKYEIIAQRLIDDTQTLFEATAPDGSALVIVWYDLATSELEWAFQSYRQTLRALKRHKLAAVGDLVSRPGAHYVTWQRPPSSPAVAPSAELLAALGDHGLGARDADIRLGPEGQPLVYGLAFNEHLVVSQPSLPTLGPAASQTRVACDRARLAPWALGSALTALGLAFFALSFWMRSDNSLVVVPPLIGQEVNAAARELHALGLAVDAEAAPAAGQALQVIAVEPAAGTQLRRGRSVTLRYALPPGHLSEARVPDLRGYLASASDAYALLEEARLEQGEIARIAAEVPRGTILAQSPAAGSRAPLGGSVDLLVSDGPRAALTFLPELRGLPLDEAVELVRLAGLSAERVSSSFVTGAPAAPGTVLEQSLPPFTPIPRDLAVLQLTVAGSPVARLGESGLPNLWMMSRDEAERAVLEAGFSLGRVQEVHVASLPQGVVAQSPGAGARPGEDASPLSVELMVNVRPLAVTVEPSVEVREAPRCEFPYRFVLESGIPEGNVIIVAQLRDGNPQPVRRLRAGGGAVLEDVWTVDDPGPVTFGLLFNNNPYSEIGPVSCRPAGD